MEFVETLTEVARFVDLEWSAPVQQRSMSGAVTSTAYEPPPHAAAVPRRLAIVGRTEWQPISLTGDESDPVTKEELQDAVSGVDTERIPVFGQPARVTVDGQHIGEIWIRIAPHSIEHLERELATTFETLAIIGEYRLNSVRDLLHEQDEGIEPDRFAAINRDFSVRNIAVQALRTACEQLNREKNARKRKISALRILEDFRRMTPSLTVKSENLAKPVRTGVEAITDKRFAAEIAARISPLDGSPPDYGAALDLLDRFRSKADTPYTKAVDDLHRYLRRRTFDRGVADWLRAWSQSGVAFVIWLSVLLLFLNLTDVRELIRAVLQSLTH